MIERCKDYPITFDLTKSSVYRKCMTGIKLLSLSSYCFVISLKSGMDIGYCEKFKTMQ